MKRKVQSFSKKFKMPHLFRDDLEDIENIIKKELKPQEYKLEAQDFEYESIREIKEDKDTTSEFSIRTSLPYIKVNFCELSAEIYSGDDDIKTTGAVKKIDRIITRRERKCLWFILRIADLFAPTIFIFSLFFVFLFIREKRFGDIWCPLLFLVSSIVWYNFNLYFLLCAFSKIEFVRKKNKPNFINRNRDRIVLIIISAAIGAFLTVFFQKVFR